MNFMWQESQRAFCTRKWNVLVPWHAGCGDCGAQVVMMSSVFTTQLISDHTTYTYGSTSHSCKNKVFPCTTPFIFCSCICHRRWMKREISALYTITIWISEFLHNRLAPCSLACRILAWVGCTRRYSFTKDDRCSALLYYDYFLTFPAEVKYIWSRRFTVSTILYICCRYALLANLLFLLAISNVISKVNFAITRWYDAKGWSSVNKYARHISSLRYLLIVSAAIAGTLSQGISALRDELLSLVCSGWLSYLLKLTSCCSHLHSSDLGRLWQKQDRSIWLRCTCGRMYRGRFCKSLACVLLRTRTTWAW
jgi:hypothetical protein